MTDKALVVDLDGSLLATNTFRDYLLFTGKLLARRLNLAPLVGMVKVVAERKLRLVSHSTMKRRVLSLTVRRLSPDDLSKFVDELVTRENKVVTSFVELCRAEGWHCVLATAAPSIYADNVASHFHFEASLATPLPDDPGWKEYCGEVKLAAVKTYLALHGLKLAAVVTDHHDDIPLMRFNVGYNYLVSPSPETLEAVAGEGVSYRIMQLSTSGA